MRPVRPGASQPAGYPRLARAWRILIAAPIAFLPSLVHADATVPTPGDKGPGGDQKKPAPPPTPPVDYPDVAGEMPAPDPPRPPPKKDPKEKERPRPKLGMVLHRHAPDEPCLPLWRKT